MGNNIYLNLIRNRIKQMYKVFRKIRDNERNSETIRLDTYKEHILFRLKKEIEFDLLKSIEKEFKIVENQKGVQNGKKE